MEAWKYAQFFGNLSLIVLIAVMLINKKYVVLQNICLTIWSTYLKIERFTINGFFWICEGALNTLEMKTRVNYCADYEMFSWIFLHTPTLEISIYFMTFFIYFTICIPVT